jgi:hypothetical protein
MNLTKEQLRTIIKEELESVLSEKEGKKDACYDKVKAVYSKKGNWPSAYASGALVQCRDKGAANWGEGGKKDESLREAEITDDEKEELEDVTKQLKGAVKAHGKQAKAIEKAIKNEVKKNCGCGRNPCKTYGNLTEAEFKKKYEERYISEATYDDGTPVEEGFSFIETMNEEELEEAEYRGRKVKLNKPMRGDVKKFKVYVKDPKTGNIKKVNFGHGGSSARKKGEKTMKIRKSNPKARKNFRARHNCDNPGPKTKARYWSCRKW